MKVSQLDKQRVIQSVEDGMYPGGIHLFDSIDSTNTWSLEEARNGRQLPFVCIADHQSKGRGRRGRHWLSPSGANVYMSTAWYFEWPADKLALLPLAAGVAVLNVVRRAGSSDAWLKWPNDIFVENKKIAGILVEAISSGKRACVAVIGIGLNYAMPGEVIAESSMYWTDLVHAGPGALADRNTIVVELINEVAEMCTRYQHKAMAIYGDIGAEFDALTGRDVILHLESGDPLSGTVRGISETGELRVLVDGRERRFNSADVSLREFDSDRVSGDPSADD